MMLLLPAGKMDATCWQQISTANCKINSTNMRDHSQNLQYMQKQAIDSPALLASHVAKLSQFS